MDPPLMNELEEAFQQRATTKQKILHLRDTILGLQQPTMRQLTELKRSLWAAYHEFNGFHGIIIGSVPEEGLAEQYAECESFDELFNEAGVPLEEKLIILRNNTTVEPCLTDNDAYPWKRSVSQFYGTSSWSTPTTSWESIRKELRGRAENRSRSEILDAKVVLGNHLPPTSDPSSQPEPWSRPHTLEADKTLRSPVLPTNGPCRRSKPTSASDVLESEGVMRDHFLPFEPRTTNESREPIMVNPDPINPTDLPVSTTPSDITTETVFPLIEAVNAAASRIGRVHPDDGDLLKVEPDDTEVIELPSTTKPLDKLYDHDSNRDVRDDGLQKKVDFDEKATAYTASQHLANGEAHTDTIKPRPAVKLHDELDQPRREPQLPTAAKAPYKHNEPNARRSQQGSGHSKFQKMQADNRFAAEEPRWKIDLSLTNPGPTDEVSQQGAHPVTRPTNTTSCDRRVAITLDNVNVSHQHPENNPAQKQQHHDDIRDTGYGLQEEYNQVDLLRAFMDGGAGTDSTEPLPEVGLAEVGNQSRRESRLPTTLTGPDRLDIPNVKCSQRTGFHRGKQIEKLDNRGVAEESRNRDDVFPVILDQGIEQSSPSTREELRRNEGVSATKSADSNHSYPVISLRTTCHAKSAQVSNVMHTVPNSRDRETGPNPKRRDSDDKRTNCELRNKQRFAPGNQHRRLRLEGQRASWILSPPPCRNKLVRWIRDAKRCQANYNNRQESHFAATSQRDSWRTPKDESEPVHRKCSVGKRKLTRPERPTTNQNEQLNNYFVMEDHPDQDLLLSGLNGGSMFGLAKRKCPSCATRNLDAHGLTAQPV